MVELDEDGAEATCELFRGEKWTIEAVEADYNQRPRILIAHRTRA